MASALGLDSVDRRVSLAVQDCLGGLYQAAQLGWLAAPSEPDSPLWCAIDIDIAPLWGAIDSSARPWLGQVPRVRAGEGTSQILRHECAALLMLFRISPSVIEGVAGHVGNMGRGAKAVVERVAGDRAGATSRRRAQAPGVGNHDRPAADEDEQRDDALMYLAQLRRSGASAISACYQSAARRRW